MGHEQFRDLFPYIEEESRDRGVSLYVDHGECIWEVTLTGAHEEQPGHNKNPWEQSYEHVQTANFE